MLKNNIVAFFMHIVLRFSVFSFLFLFNSSKAESVVEMNKRVIIGYIQQWVIFIIVIIGYYLIGSIPAIFIPTILIGLGIIIQSIKKEKIKIFNRE